MIVQWGRLTVSSTPNMDTFIAVPEGAVVTAYGQYDSQPNVFFNGNNIGRASFSNGVARAKGRVTAPGFLCMGYDRPRDCVLVVPTTSGGCVGIGFTPPVVVYVAPRGVLAGPQSLLERVMLTTIPPYTYSGPFTVSCCGLSSSGRSPGRLPAVPYVPGNTELTVIAQTRSGRCGARFRFQVIQEQTQGA